MGQLRGGGAGHGWGTLTCPRGGAVPSQAATTTLILDQRHVVQRCLSPLFSPAAFPPARGVVPGCTRLSLPTSAHVGWGRWDRAGDSGAGLGTGLLAAHTFPCHPGDRLPKPPHPHPGHILPAEDMKTSREAPGRTKSPLACPCPEPSAALPGKGIKGVSEINSTVPLLFK